MKKKNWIKRHKIWTGIIAFFVLMFFIGLVSDDTTETTPLSKIEIPNAKATLGDNSASTTPLIQSEEETNISLPQTTSTIKVTRVIDGDTIEISTGERVRLICIDSRETGEPYYQEAKDYLTDLILNKEVELVKDKSETDRYDRLLRYIYLDGNFINEMLVENGYAKAYPYSPDTTLCPQIQEAEARARSNDLGIWTEKEETSGDNSGYICSYNAYNCGDFSTHAEAQAVFDACGSGDVHKLDRDNDGRACEALP